MQRRVAEYSEAKMLKMEMPGERKIGRAQRFMDVLKGVKRHYVTDGKEVQKGMLQFDSTYKGENDEV